MRDRIHTLLGEAIDREHPCDDVAGCDIGKARELDLNAWAARLLIGATECPQTEAFYSAWQSTFFDDEKGRDAALEEERLLLLNEPHWTCETCNGVNWTERSEDWTCHDCGAKSREEVE